MGKKVKKCPKICEQHAFRLKPVHYSAVFSRELSASFCPTSDLDSSITPKFNNDKRHFTVSFYLPLDNQKLSKDAEFYKNEHEKYKLDQISGKSNIFQIKPKSKYSYCNVCKLEYDDYLKHIRSTEHKIKIRKNQFSFYIDEMCEEIGIQTQRNHQLQKKDDVIEFKEKIHEILIPSFFYLAQKLELNKETNLSLCQQVKQKFTPFNSYKSFHAFSQLNSQKSLAHPEEHDISLKNPPFSPLKRCSQVTEGVRLVSNIRPIILHGSHNDLKF